MHIDDKKSRAPELSLVSVTATLLDAVKDLVDALRRNRELSVIICQFHAQRRKLALRGAHFIAVFDRTEMIRCKQSFIYGGFVMSEIKCRAQLEAWTRLGFEDPVDEMDGILQMQHQDAFLEDDTAHAIGPDR